jgi:type IV pilus assembly protein PilB
VGITEEEAIGKMMKPVGCATCNNTGFRGRKAIFELMTMNSQIRELAFNLAPISEIRRAAIANGMRPLVDDGKIKILNGLATAEEVAKMTQVDVDNLAAAG